MTDPDFARRLAAARAEMTAAGLGASSSYPPLFRLLSRLGLPMRPPLYHGFAMNFLFQALFFGVTWGAILYFWIWRGQGMPMAAVISFAALAGVLFGLFMALYARWQAKRKNLSRWENL